jgi:carbonic anhydrase
MLRKMFGFVVLFVVILSSSAVFGLPILSPLMGELVSGNQRFISGTSTGIGSGSTPAVRKSLALSQSPKVIVLDCSDSRLTPEIIFDKGLGELFVVRVAGNVIAPHQIASIEYAIEHLLAEAVVILGHERCGAVSAAMAYVNGTGAYDNTVFPPLTPDLQTLVTAPSLANAVATTKGGSNITNNCILTNVKNVYAELSVNQVIINELAKLNSIFEVNEAFYDLDDGKVTFTSINGSPLDTVHSVKAGVNVTNGGTVKPTDAGVEAGGSQTFYFTPAAGFKVSNVTVNGIQHIGNYAEYTLSNVTGDTNVVVTFVNGIAPTGSVVFDKSIANSITASLTISSPDAISMQFSKDGGVTWFPWEAYNTTRTVSMIGFPAGDGLKTISIRFKDINDNVSVVYNASIQLDMTKPAGTVIINPTATNSATLSLSCTDGSVIGCNQMSFSKDNINWFPWESFATARNVTLVPSGPGQKFIYVRYRDLAGNISITYSTSINL